MSQGEGTQSLRLLAKSITVDGDVFLVTTALSILAEAFDNVMIAIDQSHLPFLTHVKYSVGQRVLPRDRVLAGVK